jgi:hypothetical protein
MMVVCPGDLRLFHLARRSEVFCPTTEEQVISYDRAYFRELRRGVIVPTIELLDDVFPLIAAAYRYADIAKAEARIYNGLEEYEDDPDEIVEGILKLHGSHDLKLYFHSRAELARFLQAYEALLPSS